MAYKDLVLASGAVGLWELSEAAGTFADFYLAAPNVLTLTGSASRNQPALYVGGPPSISFNGTASYLSATAFGAATGSFTAEAIVSIAAAPVVADVICGRTNNTAYTGTVNFRLIVLPDLSLSLFIFTASFTSIVATSAPGLVKIGEPFHVAARFEASTAITIWFNSVQVALTPAPDATLQASNNVFSIGAGYGPLYSNATISNLAVYTKSLSALEIGQHAAAVIPGIGARLNAAVSAQVQYVNAYGGITVTASNPMGVAVGMFGGVGRDSAPSPIVHFSGGPNSSDEGLLAACPMQSVSAFGGATATLTAPVYTLSASATGTNFGKSALVAPMQKVAATGTVSEVGNFGEFLGPKMGLLIGYGGAISRIVIGCQVVDASGTAGSVGWAALSCPLFELTANATENTHGAAELIAPMGHMVNGAIAYLIAPMGKLTAIGSAVVSATYEAYAVNLTHTAKEPVDEVTHYTNFPFDKIVRYKNSYFGMNATGLYLLEGTTDDGTPTPYVFETALTDFGAPEHKTVVSARMGGKLAPAETVTLFVGDMTSVAYPYTTPRGDYAQTYRQKFGRGIKARYFALGVSGVGGFELDTLDLEINKLTRSI